jgi:hypothetical protein
MWFSDHQRKSLASSERSVPHHCILIHPSGQRDHGTAYDAGDHQVLPTDPDDNIAWYLSDPSDKLCNTDEEFDGESVIEVPPCYPKI